MPDSEPIQPLSPLPEDSPETHLQAVEANRRELPEANPNGNNRAPNASDGGMERDSAHSGLEMPKLPGPIPPGDWPRGKYAATGGAVAAVALGSWALLTFWLTDWTLLNASAGLALGVWGLQSPRPRTAILGLGLNLLALLACLAM